jgi:methylated-DNA-[protein]-cysteine S-methyltransferase
LDDSYGTHCALPELLGNILATTEGFALFATKLGDCAIAWSTDAKSVTGVLLPEENTDDTRSRMQARFSEVSECKPPHQIQLAIGRIAASLEGSGDNLADILLDMTNVPPFNQRVYALARNIKPGETLTYGELAAQLGQPGTSRAVGQALGRNPFAPVVPCHRILAAGNRPGGFSAGGGIVTKLRMLEIEGAQFGAEPGLFQTHDCS